MLKPMIRSWGAPGSKKKLSLSLVIMLVLSMLVVDLAPVQGQTTRQRLQEAQRRAEQLQDKLEGVSAEHSRRQSDLYNTRAQISATRREMDETETRISRLQGELRDRVRTAYRMGGLGFFQFLLSAESFRDFSLRVVLLERQSADDEQLVLELRKLRAELTGKERMLDRQREEQSVQVSAIREQARELESTFQEIQSLVDSLEGQVREEERQALLRSRRRQAAAAAGGGGGGGGGGSGGPVFSLQACPVPGPRTFTNDWGAPRGGGRRSHRGNDIFAPNGAPSAAVVDGRISTLRSGGIGGLAVWLAGDDGNRYYYAHMSGFAVSQGDRVSAGQTIAYVGNTGNARGTSPHVHFEIHPGGRGAVNPYWSLIRVC